jgi:hypothetical protein
VNAPACSRPPPPPRRPPRLARQRYDSGLVDFQTVLDTQRTQLSTQDSLATATADVSADHVRLFKALGGGWLPRRPAGAAPFPRTRFPVAMSTPEVKNTSPPAVQAAAAPPRPPT